MYFPFLSSGALSRLGASLRKLGVRTRLFHRYFVRENGLLECNKLHFFTCLPPPLFLHTSRQTQTSAGNQPTSLGLFEPKGKFRVLGRLNSLVKQWGTFPSGISFSAFYITELNMYACILKTFESVLSFYAFLVRCKFTTEVPAERNSRMFFFIFKYVVKSCICFVTELVKLHQGTMHGHKFINNTELQ